MKSNRNSVEWKPQPGARQVSRVLVNQCPTEDRLAERPVFARVPAGNSQAADDSTSGPRQPNHTSDHPSWQRDDDGDDDDEEADGEQGRRNQHDQDGLQEVYLFDCCGLTRELRPVHEFAGPFKAAFLLFNTLVFLFGLADLGMGLWFRIDPKVYEIHKYIQTQNYTIAGWILLFGGFVACLTSLMGTMASFKHNSNLSTFVTYLFIIIVLEFCFVSATIMLTIHGLGSRLEMFLIKELYEQIRRRTMNTDSELFISNEAVQFLDYVQVKMRCCGAVDFRDYQKLGMVIPTTCYTFDGNYINAPGCGRAIRRLMDIRAGMATGFCVGSVVSQLFASLICSLMICSIYSWRTTPSRDRQAALVSDGRQRL